MPPFEKKAHIILHVSVGRSPGLQTKRCPRNIFRPLCLKELLGIFEQWPSIIKVIKVISNSVRFVVIIPTKLYCVCWKGV